MLAFVLTLCAWTTASGYNLTATTQTQCGVTFKVDNAVVTAADANAEVTIVIAPTAGYEVSTVTATAYMSTGEMQAPRRAGLVQELTVSPAVSAGTNEYTITMPAANVKVDVVCVASTQTVTSADVLPATAAGTFTFTPASPKTGETVTVTPTPAAGWQVATVRLDGDGDNGNVNATQSGSNYTYDQPGYGGAITVTFVKTAYTVGTGTVSGGSVSAITAATRADGDPATPAATDFYIGDVVTFTATPTTVTDHLKSLTVSFAGQTATVTPTATTTANQYQFTMLAGNATVSAEFTPYVSLDDTNLNPLPASTTQIYDATLVTPAFRNIENTDQPTIDDILKAVTGGATDIEIAWYHSSDMTTPIGTGETYTIKDSDPGYGIVYVITQSKDESGAALVEPRTKTSSAVAIGKADPTVTSAPSAVDGTLTYSENPQTLFNTGTPSGGTMKYKVTTTGTKPTSTTDFNTTIDQGTDVGTYYLWYYVEGNDSYNSTAINDVAITKAIDKAAPTYTAPAFTALTYTGSAQDLVSAGTSSHGTFTYSTEQTGTYTSTLPQGTNAGDYTVWYKFTGDVNHTNVDATEVTGVKINPKSIDGATVTLREGSSTVNANTYTYDGNEKTPTAIVRDGSKTLTAGTDYTITYENNVNAGTATATIVGQGNYTGGPEKTFTIKKAASALSFSSPTSVTKKYNDDDFTKTATVTKGDGAVTYSSSNTNVATVDPTSGLVHILKHNNGSSITIRATIAATANYNSATASYYLYVNGISLSAATFALTQTSYEYDGTAKQPGIYNVELGSNILTYGTDYYYDYSNNVNAGTAYARIYAATGSNYQGEATMSFTIRAKNVTTAMMGDIAEQTYTGQALTPEFTVKDGSKTLVAGTDYTVAYANNTVPGNATATITGQGNYAGTASKTFTIRTKALTADMIDDIAEQTYTGGPLTPELTVTNGTTPLVKGTDYTVAYANNIEPGTATATVTGQGYYTGTVTKNFTIVKNTTPDTEDEANITIGPTGKSTFVSTRDVDFTNSTAKAYIAVGYDKGSNELTLSRIYKVPAGTPVMVKADNPGLFEVPFTTGATYEYLNLLVGNTSASTVEIGETAGSNTNYVLTQGEFKSVTNNAYIPTGKAYLQLPSSFPAAHAGSALTVTLTASGKSTLCSSVDLDFSAVSDMKAYVATGYDRQTKRVMLSHVQKVSAGTPLVLHGRSNTTYTIPSVAAQTTFVNMFVGNNSGAAITVYPTSGSMKNYYLGSGEFKAVVDYLTVPDGKAYLQLPASAGTRSTMRSSDDDDFLMEVNDETLVIRLDGADATSVEGLLKAAAEQDVYYNLNGQRTENPGKGIYVKKGQKVVIK